MTDPYEKIEREVRHIGDVHAQVSMADRIHYAESLRLLLDVARAADKVKDHTRTAFDCLELEKTLTALREYCDD